MRAILKNLAGASAGIALLIGLPLLGVRLAGEPLEPYLQMPPRTDFVPHAPFSWPVFLGLAMALVIILSPFAFRIGYRALWGKADRPVRPFPAWGWAALAFGLAAWVLAWTRFAWFKSLQPFTFTPLWLAYSVVMNALTFRRTGRSPLTDRPAAYLLLFPLSAGFWWFFEYLNRYVQNWHYVGIASLTPGEYMLRATLPFSTVLPAFVATRAWLASYPGLWSGFEGWAPFAPSRPRPLAWLMLGLAAAGLAGIGVWSEILFPLLWISPVLVIGSVRTLTGHATLLGDPVRGDWRRLVMAAAAALVCGFFWEMWNILSQEKWIYTVPFVEGFHLFEMPLLGYAGYLPFGIECALVAEWVGLTGREEVS